MRQVRSAPPELVHPLLIHAAVLASTQQLLASYWEALGLYCTRVPGARHLCTVDEKNVVL